MNDSPFSRATVGVWFPRLAILALAAWVAGPSLAGAWLHDVYSRGGGVAFALWTAGIIASSFIAGAPVGGSQVWPLAAVFSCAAGSMADLRVLHHAGLAFALAGFAGTRAAVPVAIVASLAWMPAAGWFLSRVRAGGLSGWERPLASAAAMVALLVLANLNRRSQI